MRRVDLQDVLDILQGGHRQGDDAAIETLNRLWFKHLWGHRQEAAYDAPSLSGANTETIMSGMTGAYLKSLDPTPRVRKLRRVDVPVVVVRWAGRDHLIDGGRRVHLWAMTVPDECRDVLLLNVVAAHANQ